MSPKAAARVPTSSRCPVGNSRARASRGESPASRAEVAWVRSMSARALAWPVRVRNGLMSRAVTRSIPSMLSTAEPKAKAIMRRRRVLAGASISSRGTAATMYQSRALK